MTQSVQSNHHFLHTVLRPVMVRSTCGYDPNGHEYEGKFHRFVEGTNNNVGCSCQKTTECYAVVELDSGKVVLVGLFDHDITFMDRDDDQAN